MNKGIKLCMSCMNSVPTEAPRCPHCGFNGHQAPENGCLPIGYRLAGRYVIGMRLAQDGDSITYIAYDCTLEKTVEICEFFFKEGCERDENNDLVPNAGAELQYKTSLMDFSDLYKNLRKIEGKPGLVRVADFTEANNTAYAVLEQFDGVTLREFLSLAGGTITCEQALKLLTPVIEGVEAIHAVNLIHRGISPETIFINRNGDIKLGGYATSQMRTKGTDVTGKLYGGFAAPEQYATTSWQNTATDIYALAAVFYRCVTGIVPQDAEQRRSFDTLEPLASVNDALPAPLSRAVTTSMLINAEARTQTAPELLKLLHDALYHPELLTDKLPEDGKSAEMAQETDEDDYAPMSERRYKIWRFIAIAVGFIAIVVIMIFAGKMLLGISGEGDEETLPVSTVTMVDVPNFVGEKFSEYAFDTENFSYTYAYVYDGAVAVDEIVGQDPPAGTRAEKGAKITLTINKGARIEMPELFGLSLDEAIRKLKDLGIPFADPVEKTTDQFNEGLVIDQSIAAGQMVDPLTQRVTLTVAKAPPTAPVEVPPENTGTGEGTGG